MLFLYLAVLMGALVAGVYALIHGAPKRKAQGALGFVIALLAIVLSFSFDGSTPNSGPGAIAVPTLRIVLALAPFVGAFIAATAMATAKVDRLSKVV